MDSVSLNGKTFSLDKVLALISQSAKTNYSKDQIAELKSLDIAVVSDKTKHLIITPFEGSNVVLVKPSDYDEQLSKGSVQVAFYSKFLMKKLNTENVIIDTTPIDNRPRYDNRDRYERNDRPRSYERRDGYRNDSRSNGYSGGQSETRSFDRNSRPPMNRSWSNQSTPNTHNSSRPTNGNGSSGNGSSNNTNRDSRSPQKPRLFDTPRPSVNKEFRQ